MSAWIPTARRLCRSFEIDLQRLNKIFVNRHSIACLCYNVRDNAPKGGPKRQYSHEWSRWSAWRRAPTTAPPRSRRRKGGYKAKEISDIFRADPRRRLVRATAGACKLTLTSRAASIEERSGDHRLLRHDPLRRWPPRSCPARPILEALNTDLVCDAINTACASSPADRIRPHAVRVSDDGPAHRAGARGPGQGFALPDRHHVRHQGQRRALIWRWPKLRDRHRPRRGRRGRGTSSCPLAR